MTSGRPLVVHVIAGLGNGGAEATLVRLCRGVTDFRHHVISLTDEGRYGEELPSHSVGVTTLGMSRGRVGPAGLWRLWRELRRLRPDVVQTWMYHADLLGGLAARAAGVRNVIWNIRHSTLDGSSLRRSTRLVARLCALSSGWLPARIICCAHAARDNHVAFGYAQRRMVVIHNGYDRAGFSIDSAEVQTFRSSLGLDGGEVVLGMVARLHPDKDHRGFLQALARLRRDGFRFRVLLAGPDMTPDNPLVQGMLAETGLSDRVTPIGPRTDIATVMSSLDVHVLASRTEAFPNVVAEAMLCSTPCVVTDVGDAAEIAGDTGWIVPAGDPDALAAALKQAILALADADAWQARRRAARERVARRYSLDRMRSGYRSVWATPAGGRLPFRNLK
ncbi:MAG: glycosyl transferase family 1 [Alphaproteobacteria bacterium HGW-Alphaproteobacteria-2]|nr:MAG: glycosyl transferase family 1 [Alphaproteobacteria bacterium HGW-Alphaproteobacteria-2]